MKEKQVPAPMESHFGKIQCYGQFDCEFCGISRECREHQDDLVGKVLTVVDASITDESQRKAIKDLIKGQAYESFDSLRRNVIELVHDCTKHQPTQS